MNIDVHAHIIVSQALRTTSADEAWRPRVWRDDAGRQWLEYGGTTIGAARREFVHVERILGEQSKAGVDLTLLSPWSSLFNYDLDPSEALTTCRLQNEAVAQLVAEHPRHLAGLAVVPLQDPAVAAQELARSVEELGLAGAEIGSNINGAYLGDDRFEPFWAEVTRLKAFIFIHPVRGVGGSVMGEHYLWNVIGNPMETGLAAAHMILKGVLERYPDLKICLAHAGGTLPYLIGRLNRGFKVQRPVQKRISQPPLEYLRRFYFDTISHSPAALDYLISMVGPEQILMGSDYPFDMGAERPAEMVAALGEINARERAAILGGNAAQLLGIDEWEPASSFPGQ